MTTKEQARKNLLDFKRVMDRLKIPFCLMDGTLLGAYRDKDFIRGDENDIDLGILEQHYQQFERAIGELGKLGLRKFKSWKLEGQAEGYGLIRGGNHVDIIRIHIKKDKAFNLARKCGRPQLPPVFAFVYPAECFTKFDTIEFQGTKFNIPTKTKKFLSLRYGDWKQPKRRKDDFLAVRDKAGIKNHRNIRVKW